MFGDITEAANQINSAFAKLNENLAELIASNKRIEEKLDTLIQLQEKSHV